MDVLKRLRPILVGTVAAGVLLGGTACMRVNDFQSLEQYTPSEGVPVEILPSESDSPEDTTQVPIKIRNLMIVQDESGDAVLAGAVISPIDTKLESVEGTALDVEGKPLGELKVSGASFKLKADELMNFEGQDIKVTSSDMEPGLLAELTITFATGEPATVQVPVVDGSKSNYDNFPENTPSAPIEVENP